jgi:hypothetical protein
MLERPSTPLSELELIQNPGLGAYLIWQCVLGYQEESGEAMPFPLAFLVLPLVLHKSTLEAIATTRKSSGLALFAAKLAIERENLLAVHERARILRRLTMDSLGVGVTAKLMLVHYESPSLRAYPAGESFKKPVVPERLKAFSPASQKLGYWFQKAGLHQVAITLRVDF